jgi:uncharacterized FlaG/YvyC family protein
MSTEETPEQTKTFLQAQGDKMREEMVKASDKLQELPQVKKAFELYDAQMAKLTEAMDTEGAKKVFELLTKAKEAFMKVLEMVTKKPVAEAPEEPAAVAVAE